MRAGSWWLKRKHYTDRWNHRCHRRCRLHHCHRRCRHHHRHRRCHHHRRQRPGGGGSDWWTPASSDLPGESDATF